MQHLHVTGQIRPDAIVRSGIIQPFPIEAGPADVAALTVQSFDVVRPGAPKPSGFSGVGAYGPGGDSWDYGYEPQPEEFAMMANRLARAMAQGLVPTGIISPKLLYAARLIMSGQEFVVRSAGRQAVVAAANAPSSLRSLIQSNPAALRR